MRIDPARFLALTAAMAAGCAAAPPPAIELAPTPVPPAPSATAAALPPPAATTAPAAVAAEPPKAPEGCAEDDVGSLAICSQLKVAPTSESGRGAIAACEDLTRMYRPAIAERIATCMVKKSSTPQKRFVSVAVDDDCAKNAVKTACVRPSIKEQCAEMIAACNKRRQRVKYTLDYCAHLLSAANPSFVSNYTFTMAGLHTSDGTPWAEGCWLD